MSYGSGMGSDNRFSDSPSPPPPLRPKHRHHSSFCLSACFGAVGDGGAPDSPSGVGERQEASLLRSPTTWLRLKTHELPELRGKYRALISSHATGKHHRRHHSSDFSYDPLSYALNFDEGSESECTANAEDLRYRCFSSRLPASPPRTVGVPFDKAREGKGIKGIKGREAPL
ncbi:uncharacterized protein [Elaeis guineensis]|uniref:Uncharacterized protein LOC105032238 n=1 Tax=Elaeis guineensis var. tenera TaxID=51953 RepID=A0A6I9Q976_ELAGV|nr:uncharacterized protein LOC105032238 [Elaeis guineensis]